MMENGESTPPVDPDDLAHVWTPGEYSQPFLERTEAIKDLADALKGIVPIIQGQSERLDQFIPRHEVDERVTELQAESRKKRWQTSALVIAIVFFFFEVPIGFVIGFTYHDFKAVSNATSAATTARSARNIQLIIAEVDCYNKINLQTLENNNAHRTNRDAIVLFPKDANCLEDLQKQLNSLSSGAEIPPTPTTTTIPSGGN